MSSTEAMFGKTYPTKKKGNNSEVVENSSLQLSLVIC
jgi:hypothetical protein